MLKPSQELNTQDAYRIRRMRVKQCSALKVESNDSFLCPLGWSSHLQHEVGNTSTQGRCQVKISGCQPRLYLRVTLGGPAVPDNATSSSRPVMWPPTVGPSQISDPVGLAEYHLLTYSSYWQMSPPPSPGDSGRRLHPCMAWDLCLLILLYYIKMNAKAFQKSSNR